MINQQSRRLAGILLVVLPTVIYGGYFLLMQLITLGSGYMENPLRQICIAASMRRRACCLCCRKLFCAMWTKRTHQNGGNAKFAWRFPRPLSSCLSRSSSRYSLPVPQHRMVFSNWRMWERWHWPADCSPWA